MYYCIKDCSMYFMGGQHKVQRSQSSLRESQLMYNSLSINSNNLDYITSPLAGGYHREVQNKDLGREI